jgi:hypothetical protein
LLKIQQEKVNELENELSIAHLCFVAARLDK